MCNKILFVTSMVCLLFSACEKAQDVEPMEFIKEPPTIESGGLDIVDENDIAIPAPMIIGHADFNGDGIKEQIALDNRNELIITKEDREVCRARISFSMTNGSVSVEIVEDSNDTSYIRTHYFQHVGGGTPLGENGQAAQSPEEIVAYAALTDTFYDHYYQLIGNELVLVDEINYTHKNITYRDERPCEYHIVLKTLNGQMVDEDSDQFDEVFQKYETGYLYN